jgi:Lrp/AsnC family transcriptional regulator, leucine-responsive regulatory protein
MTYKFDDSKPVDWVDLQILRLLEQNSRVSYAELARKIGMSVPSVTDRIRKLEDSGIIEGYSIRLNPAAMGFGMLVFLRLQTLPSAYPKVQEFAANTPEILELHHVTGAESFLIKAVVQSISHLESLIGKLSQHGTTATSVVLSTKFENRKITDLLGPKKNLMRH